MAAIDRNKLLDKIRALFNKTTENGCTEAEAMAALDKARAMMDAYEVSAEDLVLTKEMAAILKKSEQNHDPHGIRWQLVGSVARFCDCKAWGTRTNRGRGRPTNRVVTFAGMPSDVDFAHWLLDSLTNFVLSELAEHLCSAVAPRGMRRRVINGFVGGIADRIGHRLENLVKQSEAAATSNSRALVVIKNTAIDEAIKVAGICLGTAHGSRVKDWDSYNAGYAAGDRASFGRPVQSGGNSLYLK
jgi:hypothetical protein